MSAFDVNGSYANFSVRTSSTKACRCVIQNIIAVFIVRIRLRLLLLFSTEFCQDSLHISFCLSSAHADVSSSSRAKTSRMLLYPRVKIPRVTPYYSVLSNGKVGHSQRHPTAPSTLRWQHWQIRTTHGRARLQPSCLFCWAAAWATGALLRFLEHLGGGECLLACAHLQERSWHLYSWSAEHAFTCSSPGDLLWRK